MEKLTENPSTLKELLYNRLRKTRTTVPLKVGGSVRSSGIATLCPREEVLAALHDITRTEIQSADDMLLLSLGSDFHSKLQDEILPYVGVLYGEWKCKECVKVYGGKGRKKVLEPATDLILKPEKCTRCESVDFTYVEQLLEDSEVHITGHMDGFIRVPFREDLGVFEGKSISPRGAADIKEVPKIDHEVQVQLYMWLTGLSWAIILYWDKGTYGLNGITEHFVERDDALIGTVRETIRSIWSGIEGGPLPDRICVSASAPRAAECACRKPCFELNQEVAK